ncbi:hypothetical protein T265_10842 [Opisthorchis viverrini]|uniref:Uncharacterized protein n=1 Tax=Opisthorchis viverrini TaxID=6198 RepID=A0A074ZZV9_OPIVI|nr:hypothetical protein T265_10842 [Opisthorchis viverrini]KER20669.1 hypothetical protein T265_10842 [Opisthorchis viverrini]
MGLPKGWTRTNTIAETETGFKSVDCVLNRVYHGLFSTESWESYLAATLFVRSCCSCGRDNTRRRGPE